MNTPELSILIPAAGASQRLGQPKQLVPYKGKPLIEQIVSCALSLAPREVIVVTGANSHGVQKALRKSPVRLVHNSGWSTGMGSSIALGAEAVNQQSDGLMIFLCDQWRIQVPDLDALVKAWQSDHRLIISAQTKKYRGPPVIFPANLFEELRKLKRENGAQSILHAHEDRLTTVTIENAAWDLDTKTQLNHMQDTALSYPE